MAGAQMPRGLPGQISGMGNRFSGAMSGGGKDSLEHRDKNEDSINIYFQVPASIQRNKLDSSIIDFTSYFPIPAHHVYLGNNGNATRSILFAPEMQCGWDLGFHAFDVYRVKPENVRFYNSTRPYSELGYMLGSKAEQVIKVLITQNVRSNWNLAFQYGLVNAPGFFKSQKSNHSNIQVTSWYQSKNKRYNNYFTLLSNRLQSEENGGIKTDQEYLGDPVYSDPFNIPTKIGGDAQYSRNFFSTELNTGNRYKDFYIVVKQQYDLGQKDSLVSDSTVIPLFYPRLRFEHVFKYGKYKWEFLDNVPDSAYYQDYYKLTLNPYGDTVLYDDEWKEISNEFSIYQFPDAKNLYQFLKAGIIIQNLHAQTNNIDKSFYNLILQGEYRNRTRNKQWDMITAGKFYLNGLNAGDYQVLAELKRFAGKKGGYVDLGFRNTNRTPSFAFDGRSSFYLGAAKDFNKENITQLSATIFQPKLNLRLMGNYFLVSNYTYFSNHYQAEQEGALFNLLLVGAEKRFRVGKSWTWYCDVYLQQKTGNVPLNVPLIFTRNRIGYEGTLGFKSLNIAMGFEVKYHTPYDADGYSPLMGRYYYQDSIRFSNRPDIGAYVHFRIRNFRCFVRAENLNTLSFQNGFAFDHYNFATLDTPYPGFLFRLGVRWSFVN
jgi:hypothetical protein